jgi:nitroreductase
MRQLRPDPLPEPVLNDILEVARWSGSAGNRQPWDFVVVRDRDTLRRLATIDGANAGHLATAAAGIAVVIRPEVPDLAVKRYSGRPAPRREWPARWMALGATLAGWDRSALERPDPTQSAVRAS